MTCSNICKWLVRTPVVVLAFVTLAHPVDGFWANVAMGAYLYLFWWVCVRLSEVP
jgi:hypothetical protein